MSRSTAGSTVVILPICIAICTLATVPSREIQLVRSHPIRGSMTCGCFGEERLTITVGTTRDRALYGTNSRCVSHALAHFQAELYSRILRNMEALQLSSTSSDGGNFSPFFFQLRARGTLVLIRGIVQYFCTCALISGTVENG